MVWLPTTITIRMEAWARPSLQRSLQKLHSLLTAPSLFAASTSLLSTAINWGTVSPAASLVKIMLRDDNRFRLKMSQQHSVFLGVCRWKRFSVSLVPDDTEQHRRHLSLALINSFTHSMGWTLAVAAVAIVTQSRLVTKKYVVIYTFTFEMAQYNIGSIGTDSQNNRLRQLHNTTCDIWYNKI